MQTPPAEDPHISAPAAVPSGRGRNVVVSTCARWAASQRFQVGIIAVIILNAVVIGAETYPWVADRHGDLIDVADRVFLSIFVVEIAIRLIAYGRAPHKFFTNGWNIFDFTIVAAAFVPGIGTNVVLLRTIRILRVVRLVALLGDLRTIVRGLMRSISSLAGVAVFVVIIVYVYAVVGTALFGDDLPDEWGTAGTAMLTCFRILTLDNWDDIYFPAVEAAGWPATVYFVSFIVIATLVILNIVIAVVVTSVERAREAELAQDAAALTHDVVDRAPELADRIHSLREALDELEANLASEAARSDSGSGASGQRDPRDSPRSDAGDE